MANYTRISREERVYIQIYRKENKSINWIAKKLGRSPSTISRELKRNSWKAFTTVYNALAAQNQADERQRNSHRKTPILEKYPELARYVEDMIKEGHSPEIIAGRINKMGLFETTISHETIYNYIYTNKKELIKYLRWYNHKQRKKRGKKQAANRIRNRVFIDNRPENINNREEIGHWEVDTMEFTRKQDGEIVALNVLVERKTRLVLLTPLKTKASEETTNAIINRLSKFDPEFVKSITFDNGSENTKHTKIAEVLNVETFFCHPYSGWEKGSVENRIGLLRFFLPKGKNIDNISDELIAELEYKINMRPMKILGFKTPYEVFNSVALAT